MQILKPLIYIVDDNQAICQALSWLLENTLKVSIVIYNDPNLFLKDYHINLYGCILLDILMPGMSGFEVLEALKEKGNKMPIVILTGHGDIPMAVRAVQAGAKDFITKPFNSSKLIEKVQQILTHYEAQFKAQQAHLVLFSSLTKRERVIMRYIVAGKLSKEIAHELDIAQKTVELHRFNIMHKLKLRTVAELINLNNLINNTDF